MTWRYQLTRNKNMIRNWFVSRKKLLKAISFEKSKLNVLYL